jgi:hypothetical protein
MYQQHVGVGLFLKVAAVVFFVLAGLGIPEAPRFKYIGWGLACYAFSEILPF